MAGKLQSRPELLTAWQENYRDTKGELSALQLPLDHVRILVDDAQLAHQLRAALLELVECKALKAQFEPLQPGEARVALVQQYMNRVGPAWDTAFALLGVQPYGAMVAPRAPARPPVHAERYDPYRGR